MPRTTEGEESRRDQILREATRIFSAKTYHGTSVKDIADAVGILKSSLYYYISSKERLLFDIIMETVLTLKEDLLPLEVTGLDPLEKLRQVILAIVKFNANHREVGILWMTEQHVISSSPLNKEEVTELLEQRNRLLESILTEGMEKGVFQRLDIRMTSLSIVGLCNSLLDWYEPSGRLSYEDIADFYFQFVKQGIAA